MSTDPFVQQLRASLDLEALHSRIEPEAALAAGRRAARRHALGTAAAGALAVAAVGVGALTLPGLARSTDVRPAGSASAVATPATVAPVVDIAAGVTAATGVAAAGDGWTSGLTFGAHEVGLAPATAADLDQATAATGVAVDHGLRVLLAPDSDLVPVVAWGATRSAAPLPSHTHDPIGVTTYHSPGTGLTTRLFAGVVPPWLPDSRVVLLSNGTMRVGGADVHAVEIPTFADPTGSGTRVYLATAGPVVDQHAGRRPRGVVLVSPDGTFFDVDGTCARAPELCDSPRPDGLDLAAELRSALER